MTIKLRQVCLVASQLAPVIDDFKAVFGLEVCFVDDGVAVFGLENALLPIGANFLEIVAPVKEGTAAGRYLERRGGDGGYMVITQAASPEEQREARARAEALGVRVAWEHEHKHGHFMQLHPADVGGSFFEIDHVTKVDPPDFWPPAGGTGWESKRRDDVVTEIRGVELQSDDPDGLAKRWAEISGHSVQKDSDSQCRLNLSNADIRFVRTQDGRGPGLSAVDLTVANKSKALSAAVSRGLITAGDQITLCGTKFNLSGP